jgi:hypothetical protein
LDYVGVWTVTGKRGFDSVNIQVNAWIGNAIDAAGVFPVVVFSLLDDSVDYDIYVGLDKLDPIPTIDGGAAYFYPYLVLETPDFNTFEFGSVSSLGCDSSENWEGSSESSSLILAPFKFAYGLFSKIF